MTDRLEAARELLIEEVKAVRETLKTEKSRKRAALVRRLHEIRRALDPGYHYVSQAGQDLVVDLALGQKTGGTFLDIGAYDGISGSNSFFLEVFRGWTGILVEPVSSQAEKARAIRRSIVEEVAVSDTAGEAEFLEISQGYTQMSGLMSTYDARLLGEVRKDSRHAEVVHKVRTRTLADLIAQLGTCPDFISLDIEGGEQAVLEGFPFAEYPVQIWAIENNSGASALRRIMNDAGYDLIEFCGPDEVYRLRSR